MILTFYIKYVNIESSESSRKLGLAIRQYLYQSLVSEGQMMKMFQKLMHAIKMVCSSKYATNFRVAALLAQLDEAIECCVHRTAPMSRIRSLVEQVESLDYRRRSEAVALLARANNFDCMKIAVELDPKQGAFCADRLMATARVHLELCGHGDRAVWARKRLLLAREFYRVARRFPAWLEQEIQQGLEKTGSCKSEKYQDCEGLTSQ